MNIRQVQIVLPTFNGFSSLLANKLFDLVFITEPYRVGAALKTICVILQKKQLSTFFLHSNHAVLHNFAHSVLYVCLNYCKKT